MKKMLFLALFSGSGLMACIGGNTSSEDTIEAGRIMPDQAATECWSMVSDYEGSKVHGNISLSPLTIPLSQQPGPNLSGHFRSAEGHRWLAMGTRLEDENSFFLDFSVEGPKIKGPLPEGLELVPASPENLLEVQFHDVTPDQKEITGTIYGDWGMSIVGSATLKRKACSDVEPDIQ